MTMVKTGNEFRNGRFSQGELLRNISDLIGRRRELSEGTMSPGVEAWDVAVAELALREHELLAKKSGSEMLNAEIERLIDADPSLKVERLDRVADIDEGQSYDADDATERDSTNAVGGLLRPTDVTEKGIRGPSHIPHALRVGLRVPTGLPARRRSACPDDGDDRNHWLH